MHQTTIRFSSDLWEALEAEAARGGVSVAHYVRDAAVTQLAFASGAEYGRREFVDTESLAGRIEAEMSSADVVLAQGRLALGQARRVRAKADELHADSELHREEEKKNASTRGTVAEEGTRSGGDDDRQPSAAPER